MGGMIPEGQSQECRIHGSCQKNDRQMAEQQTYLFCPDLWRT